MEKYNTNEAAESKDGKEYQAISAPAQINKTMNDSGKSFTIDAKIQEETEISRMKQQMRKLLRLKMEK